MRIGSVSPKHDQGVGVDRDEGACSERTLRRVAGRQLNLPPCAEPPRRQREDDRLEVRVEDEQERFTEDRLASRRLLANLPAVEEDPERPRLGARPVALSHPPPVRSEPPRVGQAALAGLAGEERRPPEDRVLPP